MSYGPAACLPGFLQILLLNQHQPRCQPGCAALQVLLLDEITVDMDVVGRLDLLQFFQ